MILEIIYNVILASNYRNILCFPICDEENIIGVAQLCNKVGVTALLSLWSPLIRI